MLTEPNKQAIRDHMRALAAATPGFRSRGGQRLMVAEVAKALGRCLKDQPPVPGSTIVCVSAGTGVGKSIGYSLPSVSLAADRNKTLVIASSTVALQEQLIHKDLPMLFRAINRPFNAEIAKGRTRYVCRYRLEQVLMDMAQGQLIDHDDQPLGGTEGADRHRAYSAMSKDIESGHWNGDRDLRQGLTDEIWNPVTTDRSGCLNRVCPAYSSCAQFAARKRIKEARVVVANHDLLLADLAMGGGVVLPDPADTFYVLDEAHNLPAKAVDAFAESHFLGAGQKMLEKFTGILKPVEKSLGGEWPARMCGVIADAKAAARYLGDAFRFLTSLKSLAPSTDVPEPTLAFEESCIPVDFLDLGDQLVQRIYRLVAMASEAAEALSALIQAGHAKREFLEKQAADLGYYAGRLEEIGQTWKLFLAEPGTDEPPVAKWVQYIRPRHAGGAGDYRLSASPVIAAQYLKSLLWDRAAGVVLTSASMEVLGGFNDFLRRTGLNAYPQVTCVSVPSPFDYRAQGTLHVPAMRTSPKSPAAHTEEVTHWVTNHLSQFKAGGALFLFCSRRQMEHVASGLPPQLRALVQMQGDKTKSEILRLHKKRIDERLPSAIFGLESFSEGVDLPGDYCNTVVIPKLPFSVPDSPVLQALSRWIEKKGGDPFKTISVPDAARKLEQRLGRLIRTETDRGDVFVLDTRLTDTKYGRMILQGLPAFRLVIKGREH